MATETIDQVSFLKDRPDILFSKDFSSDTWKASNGEVFLNIDKRTMSHRDWTIALFKYVKHTPELAEGLFNVQNYHNTISSIVSGKIDDVIAWAMTKPAFRQDINICCYITTLHVTEV